jgi:hypothetical protein
VLYYLWTKKKKETIFLKTVENLVKMSKFAAIKSDVDDK